MTEYIDLNNKTWYCLSLFYSNDKWSFLLDRVFLFKEKNKELLDLIIFLSKERGEHVSFMFSADTADKEGLQDNILLFFNDIIAENPSGSYNEPFKPGKSFWAYYPENSIIWNRFSLRQTLYANINNVRLCSLTSAFIYSLAESDYSIANRISMALYMIAGLYKITSDKDRIIKEITKKLSTKTEGYKHTLENRTVINSYLEDFGPEDNASESWINEVQAILDDNPGRFHHISKQICNMLDLYDEGHLLIMDMIRDCFQNRD